MSEAPDLEIKSWEGKESEEMTPEERLDALAEILAEGFLEIAAKDPKMEWLKDEVGKKLPPKSETGEVR